MKETAQVLARRYSKHDPHLTSNEIRIAKRYHKRAAKRWDYNGNKFGWVTCSCGYERPVNFPCSEPCA